MDEKQKRIIENLQKYLENERKTKQKMIILASIFTILAFLFAFVDVWELAFLGALIAIVICYLLYLCRGSVECIANDLHMAQTDIEKYERIMNIRTINAQAQIRQNQAVYDAQHPQCPMCGSQNTQRISTLSRAASVAAIGLASSKIGKQFECKNCKYKW